MNSKLKTNKLLILTTVLIILILLFFLMQLAGREITIFLL